MEQFEFDFQGDLLSPAENHALWTPRDIWVRASQTIFEAFKEDRRFERKDHKSPSIDDLATYYSCFSNTLDGGMLVYGIKNNGEITGCSHFSTNHLNSIERCHITHCPLAKPEFKRVPVVINGRQDFCFAIFIPYIGMLVETNKGEAYCRYGESKHLMSEPEKADFRSTRQELQFELQAASGHRYPDDFDLRIIQDFCDAFRTREQRHTWSNDDILIDRKLVRQVGGKLVALNTLLLMAGNSPSMTIPGCRVRVLRFDSTTEGWGDSYSPIRDRTLEGNLVCILREAKELIASQFIYDVTWLHNEEGKFVTTPEYPQHAWYEALVNACVHRSYNFSGTEITVKFFSDRLEIESPGGFVPPVNEKTIYKLRASRNHHLMDALRVLGYVQMAKEGTRRIRESMMQYQLPEPTFRQEALHGVVVKVTLQNDQGSRKRASNADVARHFGVAVWKMLDEHEIRLLAYAYRNESIQVSEAQRLTGRTWATSKKDLEKLVKKGVLIFEPGKYIRDSKATYKLAKAIGEEVQGK